MSVKNSEKQAGFTLVELMVVVAVIVIIITIGVNLWYKYSYESFVYTKMNIGGQLDEAELEKHRSYLENSKYKDLLIKKGLVVNDDGKVLKMSLVEKNYRDSSLKEIDKEDFLRLVLANQAVLIKNQLMIMKQFSGIQGQEDIKESLQAIEYINTLLDQGGI